jgi:hypothetical protein
MTGPEFTFQFRAHNFGANFPSLPQSAFPAAPNANEVIIGAVTE